MFVEKIKEKVIIGAYSFRGDDFSLVGELLETPKVLFNIEDKVVRDMIVKLAELTFNFLAGHNFRGRFIPLMRMEELAGVNLITYINNSGIDYESRLYLLMALVSNDPENSPLDKLLLDFSVILHFNLSEKEIRSYINLRVSLEGVEDIFKIVESQSIEEYFALLLSSTNLNNKLFKD